MLDEPDLVDLHVHVHAGFESYAQRVVKEHERTSGATAAAGALAGAGAVVGATAGGGASARVGACFRALV